MRRIATPCSGQAGNVAIAKCHDSPNCRRPMTRLSSASRRARMATCISATPIRRCSTSAWRGRRDGRLLLRIEDIDTARCTPEFEAGILRDLPGSGSDWEEPVRRQSEHLSRIPDGARTADPRGARLSGLHEPRRDPRPSLPNTRPSGRGWPRDPDGVPLYPAVGQGAVAARTQAADRRGHALCLAAGHRTPRWRGVGRTLAWTEFADEDDFSEHDGRSPAAGLGRRRSSRAAKSRPATILSVVVDDALQGVSHVVRGLDLFAATACSACFSNFSGCPRRDYFHHRLILGPDGRKLSKSLRITGLAALRQAARRPTTSGDWWGSRCEQGCADSVRPRREWPGPNRNGASFGYARPEARNRRSRPASSECRIPFTSGPGPP